MRPVPQNGPAGEAAADDVRETTRRAEFAAFDRLPAPLREALNYATERWSSEDALEAVNQGHSAAAVMRAIGAV
jgi:quinol monooxygenase YgiN